MAADESDAVVTTQQTSKDLKAWQAGGFCAMLFGTILIFGGDYSIGPVIAAIGVIVTIGALLGAWWGHS